MKIKTQKALRNKFWETYPNLPRQKIVDYSGNGLMFQTDTRSAWTDFLDELRKDNIITHELARKATLG